MSEVWWAIQYARARRLKQAGWANADGFSPAQARKRVRG